MLPVKSAFYSDFFYFVLCFHVFLTKRVCLFCFHYLCHHRELTLLCTYSFVILRSSFMAYLHVLEVKVRVLYPAAYSLLYQFFYPSPMFIYLLPILLSPLSSLSSFVLFLKMCILFHNLSFPLFATVSLTLSSFFPLHVYSSQFFPDSLRYIIRVSGYSSLGSVPSSFGSPETVHCLLSTFRLHGDLLLLISAWFKRRCSVSSFKHTHTQIYMENTDKWSSHCLVWVFRDCSSPRRSGFNLKSLHTVCVCVCVLCKSGSILV